VIDGRAIKNKHYPNGNERWCRVSIRGDDGHIALLPADLGARDSSDPGINLDGISFPTSAPLTATAAAAPSSSTSTPVPVAIATPVAVAAVLI
jgi:hypothetical protein